MSRPLPAEVTDTLDAVLDPNDPVHRALRDQIPHLGVRERCTCGCGTTYFEIDTDAATPAPTGPGTLVAARRAISISDAANRPIAGAWPYAEATHRRPSMSSSSAHAQACR